MQLATSELSRLAFEEQVLALSETTTTSFGNKVSVIERLRSVSEFFHDIREDATSIELWQQSQNERLPSASSEPSILTHLIYQYRQKQHQGRVIQYLPQGDPVNCISMNRAYHEDFWPVIQPLSEDNPSFLVFEPMGSRLISPEEFEYSWEDWMQKNYEEDMWSFSY